MKYISNFISSSEKKAGEEANCCKYLENKKKMIIELHEQSKKEYEAFHVVTSKIEAIFG
jgi:hypothetical protein